MMVLVTVVKRVSVVISPATGLVPAPTERTAVVAVAVAVAVTGQMVVDTRIVSVVTEVVLEEAGQSWTLTGQAVIVAVRVLNTLDVVYAISPAPVLPVIWGAAVVVASAAVTGQMVVETTMVSVVM